MTLEVVQGGGNEMRTAEPYTRTIDCAWCAFQFDDVVDLLDHVESAHLDPHPLDVSEPDLDAAA